MYYSYLGDILIHTKRQSGTSASFFVFFDCLVNDFFQFLRAFSAARQVCIHCCPPFHSGLQDQECVSKGLQKREYNRGAAPCIPTVRAAPLAPTQVGAAVVLDDNNCADSL